MGWFFRSLLFRCRFSVFLAAVEVVERRGPRVRRCRWGSVTRGASPLQENSYFFCPGVEPGAGQGVVEFSGRFGLVGSHGLAVEEGAAFVEHIEEGAAGLADDLGGIAVEGGLRDAVGSGTFTHDRTSRRVLIFRAPRWLRGARSFWVILHLFLGARDA